MDVLNEIETIEDPSARERALIKKYNMSSQRRHVVRSKTYAHVQANEVTALFQNIWKQNHIEYECILVNPVGTPDEQRIEIKDGCEDQIFDIYLTEMSMSLCLETGSLRWYFPQTQYYGIDSSGSLIEININDPGLTDQSLSGI